MKQFPRFRRQGFFLIFCAGALFMFINAAKRLFPLEFGSTPPVMRVIVTLFLVVWFCLVGSFVLFGLAGLHAVRIGRGEIQVCLGKLVLRRIHAEQVKTVGIGFMATGRGANTTGLDLLVLSERTAEELNEKGQKFLCSKDTAWYAARAMYPLTGPFAAARAYLLNHYLRSLLWMEYSPEAEAALRQTLTTTKFLF